MSTHFVVAYVNDGKKCFTLTARKREARLSEVDAQSSAAGYRHVLVASGLSKAAAEARKQVERAIYESRSYTYKTRSQLP